MLACLTGLRFSDFSILQPDDLRNDLLYKKQEKSEHWVVIPLRKEAKIIFSSAEQYKITANQLETNDDETDLAFTFLGKRHYKDGCAR